MTTLAITLRDEHQKFVEEAVSSGRYTSESEVVADALAELKIREAVRQARMAELRAQVDVGLEELDRGEGEPWDVEAIKAEGRALLASRCAQT